MAQTSTPQSFVITTKSKLSTLPVKNGQAIFVKDAGKIYYDWDNVRTAYHAIIELATQTDRTGMQSPSKNKFYLVEEDWSLWRYNGTSWLEILSEPGVVFTESPVTLPVDNPKANTLYVAGTQLYKYDTGTQQFVEIAKNKFVWGTF